MEDKELIKLTTFRPGCKEQCKHLSGMKAELDEADLVVNVLFSIPKSC